MHLNAYYVSEALYVLSYLILTTIIIPIRKMRKRRFLERLSNLPKKCDLNSGSLTQETTLSTTRLFLNGVTDIVDALYLSVNKNFYQLCSKG